MHLNWQRAKGDTSHNPLALSRPTETYWASDRTAWNVGATMPSSLITATELYWSITSDAFSMWIWKSRKLFFFVLYFQCFFVACLSQPFTRSVVVISCYSKTGGFKWWFFIDPIDGASKNARGVFPKIVGFPPRSSILRGIFHYFHHPFWGFPTILGNHPHVL